MSSDEPRGRFSASVAIPVEAHQPMREAIAPNLSSFNAASDVKGFIVVALGADFYEVRTDLAAELAGNWMLSLGAEMKDG